VVLVYAGVVTGIRIAHRRPHEFNPDVVPARLVTGTGSIVVMTVDGSIETTDPGGRHARPLPGLGTFQGPASTSADSRLIAISANGHLQGVIAEQPAPAPVRIDLNDLQADITNVPFADRDRDLVLSAPGPAETVNAIGLLTINGGHLVGLGLGDDAAGDPQTLGAFVSVEATVQPAGPPPGGLVGQADSLLQLDRPGRAPVEVASAAQLQRDVRENPDSAVHLSAFPSPGGDKLAVVLDPPGGGDSNAPMVVVDRTGRPLGTVAADQGPREYQTPAWSPDGTSLAYTTFGPRGAALVVWTVGRTPQVRVTPDPGDDFSGCLWSPPGTEILCANVFGVGQSTAWILGASRRGLLYVARAPGMPVAWLPGSPAGAP